VDGFKLLAGKANCSILRRLGLNGQNINLQILVKYVNHWTCYYTAAP
jgi:hypothetical protein